MTRAALPASPAAAIGDIADALRFFTRLPLSASPRPFDFNRMAWATPLVGAVVGVLGAGVLALTQTLGLPPFICAALATALMIAATGALHEDGLADVADGWGGGSTRDRKLAIMRDSSIGAYGAVALTLSLILRVGALGSALSLSLWSATGALVIVAALSRAGALMPLALLDPARSDGAGASAGGLNRAAFAAAWSVALLFVLFAVSTIGAGRAIGAAVASATGAAAVTALAFRQIGGQTGDVAGAAQQVAEIAGWCGFLVGRFTT